MSHYQWNNIGQYSNIRKRTEGQLANQRLNGETELQSLHQNTLAYFRAKAKQREAEVMGKPFGLKEVHDCLPNLRFASGRSETVEEEKRRMHEQLMLKKASERRVSRPVDSFSNTATVARPSLSHRMSFPESPTPAAHSRRIDHPASMAPYALPTTSTSSLKFGSMPSQNVNFGGHSRPGAGISGGTPKLLSHSDNYGSSLNMYDHDLRRGVSAEHGNMRYSEPLLEAASAHLTIEQYLTMQRSLNKQSSDASAYQTNVSQPSRVSMRDVVQKVADSATARGSSTVPQRTVLHDPLRSSPQHPAESQTAAPLPAATSHPSDAPRNPSSAALSSGAQNIRAPPGLPYPSSNGLPRDLLDSEPEDDWRRRPVDVVNFRAPHMTNEELRLHSRPTPQTFNGPFFTDNFNLSGAPVDHRSNDDWYAAGKRRSERHDDYLHHVMARNRLSVSSSGGSSSSNGPPTPRHPGVIGRPANGACLPLRARDQNAKPVVNPITTRLLIPVLENLMTYAQDSKIKRRDHWTPWCDPPDYAIDKGPDGNMSMFDKEWERRYNVLVAEKNKARETGRKKARGERVG